MKLAVVLFNLGGPDRLDAVEPFLRNLFSDPAIIAAPGLVRPLLARYIAMRRAPIARDMYAHMGGASPLLRETEAQARALEEALAGLGEVKCFIAMRYWHPMTDAAAKAVKAWGAERLVLLPLYPQYSSTTTRSSRAAWDKAARAAKLRALANEICCYPTDAGFISALVGGLRGAFARAKPGLAYRVLFSAHGLPKRVVEAGDPYQWQVERTVEAVLDAWDGEKIDGTVCYQSRVGPLEWIGPATEAEITRAGAIGKGVIVVPVAFVSEHSETLVELDRDYVRLAKTAGVPDYIRVDTVRAHPDFIAGLAGLVTKALNTDRPVSCVPGRLCPPDRLCGQETETERRSRA